MVFASCHTFFLVPDWGAVELPAAGVVVDVCETKCLYLLASASFSLIIYKKIFFSTMWRLI